MSAQEFNHVGSCGSSNESSANAKATLFLASGKCHSGSYGTQSNRSLLLEIASIRPEENPASSARLYAERAGTCILNQPASGSDDMCLSPLAQEGRCHSLASIVASYRARTTVTQVCGSSLENYGPTNWPHLQDGTNQNLSINFLSNLNANLGQASLQPKYQMEAPLQQHNGHAVSQKTTVQDLNYVHASEKHLLSAVHLPLQSHISTSDEQVVRSQTKTFAGQEASKDMWAHSLTFGSMSTRANMIMTATQTPGEIVRATQLSKDSTHYVVHSLQRTTRINSDDFDCDILRWKNLDRQSKSNFFRMKRRKINIKLFGEPFSRRSANKNLNRQTAALNRKRDDHGKFLWGPRKTRLD